MRIIRTRDELNAAAAALGGAALVPTMGALHAGHLALVRAAAAAGPAVASIFVNPLQFSADEDLSRYPRDEAGDLAALAACGCSAVFLPTTDTMYPPADATTVVVAGPALDFEGAHRPGHFTGVATVVARLIGMVRPRTAWFGQKDWQQLQVIRRMVADLCLDVTIQDLAVVRAPDGLALSSRNRFLDTAQRAQAPALYRHCILAAEAMQAGMPVAAAAADARHQLTALGFAVDYLDAVGAGSMRRLTSLEEPARLVAAARLGSVRLLDSVPIG